MENRNNKNIINEELFTIDNNEFKKITYDTGEQVYKGYDQNFKAWITLKFKQTSDKEVLNEIENIAKLLL